MHIFNYLMIILIIAIACFATHMIYRRNQNKMEEVLGEPTKEDKLSIDYLANGICNIFDSILRINVEELNLNQIETQKRINNITTLRNNRRNCNIGDLGAKEYMKDYIKDLLQQKFGIDADNINKILSFDDEKILTVIDKFDIALYLYKKQYKMNAFEQMVEEYHLADEKLGLENDVYYEITVADMIKVYNGLKSSLSYDDKLEIITQRIYQKKFGNGVIDELRDMNIDGISGGIYGIDYESFCYLEESLNEADEIGKWNFSFDGIAVMYKGKSIHLSYLGFGCQEELERVCKNIYQYNSPGHLSESKGYIENDQKDGSRVVVAIKPFASSWYFFIRKHPNLKGAYPEELLVDENSQLPIEVMKWVVRGCLNIVYAGDQGSGKTTFMRSMCRYISRSYPIRVQEGIFFELHLEKIFQGYNIATFREIPTVTSQEGLNLLKRVDGAVTILGEVTKYETASLFIQLSQSGTKSTMCTIHTMSTQKTIDWLVDALMQTAGYSGASAKEATKKVVGSIDIITHWRLEKGHRYIDKISEVVLVKEDPYPEKFRDQVLTFFERMTNPIIYRENVLVEYENGKYVLKNMPTKETMDKMRQRLTTLQLKDFEKFWNEVSI